MNKLDATDAWNQAARDRAAKLGMCVRAFLCVFVCVSLSLDVCVASCWITGVPICLPPPLLTHTHAHARTRVRTHSLTHAPTHTPTHRRCRAEF